MKGLLSRGIMKPACILVNFNHFSKQKGCSPESFQNVTQFLVHSG